MIKNKITPLIFSLLIFIIMTNVQAGHYGEYKDSERIEMSYHFDTQSTDNTLYIHNINGFVEIEGYDGTDIQVDIKKTISAKTEENLTFGKHEAWFKVVNLDNQIHMFMKTPFSHLEIEGDDVHFHEKNSHQKYQYKLDYKVKVPRNTNLQIMTVNDGNIAIDGIQSRQIYAKNINGEIELKNVSAKMKIMTVNGDIHLSYLDKNIDKGYFKSINGSFTIQFVEQPDIEVTFKTQNGGFYTSYDPTNVSSFVQRETKKFKHGVKYKIKPKNKIRFGLGTHKFDFKTINGDINIINKV